jgi:bifunctional pyridoxal-dependent enzyme with beta-cystathionase and maltose regulon repressor activities
LACDFDHLIARRHTDSVKWRRYDEDVLPLWVADMDFRAPEAVIRALHERVEHGVFGYGVDPPELRKRFQAAHAGLVPGVNVMGYTALRYLEGNRDFLRRYVAERLPGVAMSELEGTYLAWLDCRQAGIPGNPAGFFLEWARVALNDGALFGRGGAGFVRLSLGCPSATLAEALGRMEGALGLLVQAPRHATR